MAIFKCDCGKILSNSICPNDIQLIVFTDREWEDIQEKVKDGFDIYDAEPQFDVGDALIVRESIFLRVMKWF
ncbi:hypothetical protein O9H85_13285 [Paenibacillus filicis]|uniref:Uncharacterized protein n=1 Tax=Paenibacillus gyeongsangnamensis TaxID=3388067 RepID=A0ABT4Q928_9BACL|nr:hypothetical protein [Paenibacillus filicis]MCZ8513383.1 hypothetical protein [Paenibacillus filicis]